MCPIDSTENSLSRCVVCGDAAFGAEAMRRDAMGNATNGSRGRMESPAGIGRIGAVRLARADRRFLWHPFTQMKTYAAERPEPPIIERAEGSWLVDVEGRRYLDANSGYWCVPLGYRRPEIDAAVRDQLDRVAHSTLLGLSSVPAIELAATLARVAPKGLGRVFYADSGSEAVEAAAKMAFQYWRHNRRPERSRFITLAEGYHGDTIGAMSLGGIELFHGAYKPLLFETVKVPPPYCYRCPFGRRRESCSMECAGAMREMIRREGRHLAAVVIEPILQGPGGMIPQPPGYLRAVAEAARKVGALLVFDEVAVGLGRCGRMFACEIEGVVPDLLCLAKGLTGGYVPLSAVLASDEVYEAFLGKYEEFKTFFHGHTYTGNCLGAAAALATLSVLEKDRIIERLPRSIERLASGLKALRGHPHVGDVRGTGMMWGVELVADKESKARFPVARRIGHAAVLEARRRFVNFRAIGDLILVAPPLTATESELDTIASVLLESADAATCRAGSIRRAAGKAPAGRGSGRAAEARRMSSGAPKAEDRRRRGGRGA